MRQRFTKTAIYWLTAAGCAAILLLSSANLSAQCAMCRTALTQSAEGERWSRGINAGIALLLAAPFAIAGIGLLVIYRGRVKSALADLRLRLPGGSRDKHRLVILSLTDR